MMEEGCQTPFPDVARRIHERKDQQSDGYCHHGVAEVHQPVQTALRAHAPCSQIAEGRTRSVSRPLDEVLELRAAPKSLQMLIGELCNRELGVAKMARSSEVGRGMIGTLRKQGCRSSASSICLPGKWVSR